MSPVKTGRLSPTSGETLSASPSQSEGFELVPNLSYLNGYTFALGLGAIQTAFAMTGSSQIVGHYQVFFGWTEDETTFWNTVINSVSIVGMILGSLFGGEMILKGRRRATILIQTAAILGSMLTMFKSLPLICIGRFLLGCVACTANIIMGKSIAETFPESQQSFYGMFVNITINFGFFFSFSLGLLLPTDDEDFASSEMWKVVTAMPALLGFISIMLWETVFTEEPVGYCIANEREDEAIRHL